MRTKSVLLLVVCVVWPFFGKWSDAQGVFRVAENETRLELNSGEAKFLLAAENPGDEFSARVKLEILSPNDYVHATQSGAQKIAKGKQFLQIPVALEKAALNDSALLWYRLRYEITPENASLPKVEGVVSFSQILAEVFELKMITGIAFEEKLFRARVRAFNPANQRAVADVRIEGEIKIEDRQEKIKAEAQTDSEGFALLEFNLPDFKMNDDIDLKIVGKKNGLSREVSDDLQSLAGRLVEVQTDKPIYQPDQTVNLRLQHYKFDRRPVKDAELTVEIENEETDETIFSEKVKTSRFGIASLKWKIPDGAKLGNYQIYVKNAEDDEIGSERIKITRYDLPNFYVEARPDRAFYLPEQKAAKIEIKGHYLFGKPLERARVRIVSQNRDGDENFKEIDGQTDASGNFSAEIDLSAARADFEPNSWRKFKDLSFSAYVTDLTTNRTEQKRFDVRLTREPIHVYLIGDTYSQSGRLPVTFYVSTFYADGRPASCEVGIYELVKEDADGNDMTPELGAVLAKVKTNSYGVARLDLPVQLREARDDLNLKLVATDTRNASGSLEEDVDITDKPVIRVETDKTVYRRGEPVKVSIISSEKSSFVFVDVVKGYQLVQATQAKLERGRAEIVLPYREDFKNGLEIAAYFEEEGDDDLIVGRKNITFPTPASLQIEAETQKDIYRPGEPVAVKFRARTGGKSFAETALGVLVLDKAIEERARAESETGDNNQFLNRTFVSRMAGLFGEGKLFGNLSVRDIENLNPSKPLGADLELAVEVALRSDSYRPQLARSRILRDDLEQAFSPFFRAKMNPVLAALDKAYREKDVFPGDENSLREILLAQGLDFADLRDAWGSAFRTEFRVERDLEKLEIWSFGADKLPKTADDLTVLETGWKYFAPVGRAIDKVMLDYTRRTNGFITDYRTLRDEALKQNINLDTLRDPWGNLYRFEFAVERTNYVLTVKSNGADKKADSLMPVVSDDFALWTSRADYFTVTKANLIKNFNEYVEKQRAFPRSETEMRDILRASGFNPDETKDVFGRPFYIQQKERSEFGNFYRYQNSNLKVVRQKILNFAVKSAGQDGVRGTYDDFELANFSGATSEEEIDFPSPNLSPGRKIVRQKAAVSPTGAIGGIIFDPMGAVIPGATVTVRNALRSVNRSVKSNENGEFLIDNLSKDVYQLEVSSPGFQITAITNLSIEPGILIDVDVLLEVGNVTSTVDVSADSSVTIETSDSSVSTTITRSKVIQLGSNRASPSFTPRVRDYFAETLVWAPELVTDKEGFAQLNFKMADSLTTWKLYAIGSTETGEFGVVERELQTFQPFFAELDPPRILTEGDRIALPVPVRNYTDKRQKVAVSLAANDWSRLLGGATQSVEIAANASQAAIFNFEATSPVTDGKQRVTALAKKTGDTVEKPVTVRPNGREVIEMQGRLFEKEISFDIKFPATALPNTRRAEVKIYPNMLSHVAESVEGLLKRPYGCGEQTTSSTYPNLLILKIEKELKKQIDPPIKAKAQNYLDEGYRRLLNYQTASGGFSYWGAADTPNVALTAYILRFLTDARDFIEVDERVIERAEDWLLGQQKADGSWESNRGNADLSTAYVARSLALVAGSDAAKKKSLQRAVEFLQKRLPDINDSFVLANLGLTALETGDRETAGEVVKRLTKGEVSSWTTANTPFNGWGKTADIETTALVVQLLLKYEDSIEQPSSKGIAFLLKNKDQFGVWYSTQTTINVLDALILLQKMLLDSSQSAEKAEIFVNGQKARELEASSEGLNRPIVFDASAFLSGNENRIEIKGFRAGNLTMAQIVSTHYLNWNEINTVDEARYFDLKVNFDKTEAKIGEEITCTVQARRKNSDRDGMLLAEIGLPPGADVDRASLEKAKSEARFSSYDVLPEKIVIYFWASPQPLDFSFKFRPRFGLEAQTAPSLVYDYYNEEARTLVAPAKFIVR